MLVGRTSVLLPRKLAQLRGIQVGERRLAHVRGKPRFPSLGDLVAADQVHGDRPETPA